MNELGLSRESVRQLVEQIVTETVNKHMTTLETSGALARITEDAFHRLYRDPKTGYANFKSLVQDAAMTAAKVFVGENIRISPVTPKS
ncbi:hypothetical protein OpiT1DRAFT_05681 [Opitutaceae bacterium TAV1]|nr:hypothetical protein OpiT1DRAFT_05681 [Opitutaceae bacterium TAV1]